MVDSVREFDVPAPIWFLEVRTVRYLVDVVIKVLMMMMMMIYCELYNHSHHWRSASGRGCLSNSHRHHETRRQKRQKRRGQKRDHNKNENLTWLTKMYVEFLLLSFFITDNESFERPPFNTPFRSMMIR